jgi:hypothetical protein
MRLLVCVAAAIASMRAPARPFSPNSAVIQKILAHLGLDPQPPPKSRAREAGQDFAA